MFVVLGPVAKDREVLVTERARVARRRIGMSDTQAQQGLVELLGMVVLHGLPGAKNRRLRIGCPGKWRGREGGGLRRVSEAAGRLEEGLIGGVTQRVVRQCVVRQCVEKRLVPRGNWHAV